jgi:hypothetical protein
MGIVLPRRTRIVGGAGGIAMDAIDFLFAYLLSLFSAVVLNLIPDWNHKLLYLLISTAMVIVASWVRAWAEKEVT